MVPPEAAVFTLADALLDPRTTGFTASTGLLLLEAAAVFALPRALFASRIGSAILTIATLLRSVFTVLIHHCRHNNSNIPSVRKNLQVTSHARRKEVFANRAGDRNILGPSTPGNLQHPRQRLPELGRRHPSPEGCARPHQLHSKTVGDPQFPTAVPSFLFLVAGAASCEGPSSVTATGLFPRRSTASSLG